MDVIWMDGFDWWGSASSDLLARCESIAGNGSGSGNMWESASGRFSGGTFSPTEFGVSASAWGRIDITAQSQVYCSFWWRRQFGNAHFRLEEDDSPHLTVYWSGTTISVYRGSSSGTLLETASGTYAANTWFHVEFFGNIDNTEGAYELRIDGVTVAQGTGVDTRSGGTSGVVNNVICLTNTGSGDCRAFWDDLVIQGIGGEFLGEHRIRAVRPVGDGATTDLSVSSTSTGTSNYEMVDDTNLDHDTTYNEGASSGARDELTLDDFGFVGDAAVVGVSVAAEKLDPGVTKLRVGVRSTGGDEDISTGQDLVTLSYFEVRHLSEKNPGTLDAWKATEIAESVYEIE